MVKTNRVQVFCVVEMGNSVLASGSFFPVLQPSRHQWQIAFYIASGIYLFGAIFYALFASGEEQPWAQSEYLLAKSVSKGDLFLVFLKFMLLLFLWRRFFHHFFDLGVKFRILHKKLVAWLKTGVMFRGHVVVVVVVIPRLPPSALAALNGTPSLFLLAALHMYCSAFDSFLAARPCCHRKQKWLDILQQAAVCCGFLRASTHTVVWIVEFTFFFTSGRWSSAWSARHRWGASSVLPTRCASRASSCGSLKSTRNRFYLSERFTNNCSLLCNCLLWWHKHKHIVCYIANVFFIQKKKKKKKRKKKKKKKRWKNKYISTRWLTAKAERP